MKLSPGAKLKSAVSAAQVVVVRPPKTGGVLACGGAPMLAMSAAAPEGPQLDPATPGVQVGKRYVEEETGLEVLGAKAGAGDLSFDGRALTLKDAKKLPSSD